MTLTLGRRDDRSASHSGLRLVLGSASPRRPSAPGADRRAGPTQSCRPRSTKRHVRARSPARSPNGWPLRRRSPRGRDRSGQADLAPCLTLGADTVVGVGRTTCRSVRRAITRSCASTSVRTRPSCSYWPRVSHWRRALSASAGRDPDRFRRLSPNEVEAYPAMSGEWRGKAGGYAIEGLAAAFVERLVGWYSNVVGLPSAETVAPLVGQGDPVHRRWSASPSRPTPTSPPRSNRTWTR